MAIIFLNKLIETKINKCTLKY